MIKITEKLEESNFINRVALREHCSKNKIEITDYAFNQMIEKLYEISDFYLETCEQFNGYLPSMPYVKEVFDLSKDVHENYDYVYYLWSGLDKDPEKTKKKIGDDFKKNRIPQIVRDSMFEFQLREEEAESGIIKYCHQQGLKVYHCENFICVVESCDTGRELKDITGGHQHYADMEEGYYRVKVPTIKEQFKLHGVDGEVKYVKTLKYKRGCVNNG